MQIPYKRITLFSGHYGSGKTNIALNYALYLRSVTEPVAVADLDIVNPYFRAKDGQDVLKQHGIQLIASAYANSNVDTPALPSETYALFDNRSIHGVIDLGGDDRGALALGRYRDRIIEENNYEMLSVVNCFRPLTRTPADAVGVMREIEAASGICFTGIVCNPNLGTETTTELILSSLPFYSEVSEIMKLPIRFITARKESADQLITTLAPVFPIEILVNQSVR